MIYAVQGILIRQIHCFINWFCRLFCRLCLLMLASAAVQATPTQADRSRVAAQSGQPTTCHSVKCSAAPHSSLSTIHLHPKIRAQPWNSALSGLSSDAVRPWLEHYLIVPTSALAQSAYVLGTADRRVIAATGQTISVRGQGWVKGQAYGVYRLSQPYLLDYPSKPTQPPVSPTQNSIPEMQELIEVARGEVIETQPNMASIQLKQSFAAEVRRGDLVFASPTVNLPARFEPISSERLLAGGQIVRVMGAIAFAAKDSIVTIDRGLRHGAQAGQVLRVAQRGEAIVDPKGSAAVNLPPQHIGHVMLLKSFDQLSYAYVLDSTVPIYVGAQLQTLSAAELNAYF